MLLPALVADQSVDLAALLDRMHHNGGGTPAPAGGNQAADSQAEVLSLLLQAAAALARAGEADRACRIAASAWAALHETRPDLAVRVTAALHGLTRRVGNQDPDETAHGGGRTPVAAPVPAGFTAGAVATAVRRALTPASGWRDHDWRFIQDEPQDPALRCGWVHQDSAARTGRGVRRPAW